MLRDRIIIGSLRWLDRLLWAVGIAIAAALFAAGGLEIANLIDRLRGIQ